LKTKEDIKITAPGLPESSVHFAKVAHPAGACCPPALGLLTPVI